MKELLIRLDACKEARDWASGKSWKEIYETCHRGDWLLWLYYNLGDYDFQLLTLAKGRCANTVRHLMKDERSIRAVDVAIGFGEGRNNRSELDASAADAAVAAAYSAYSAAYYADASAVAAAYSAGAAYSAAAYSAGDASAAIAAVAAADAAYSAYSAARKQNQKLTADIVRQTIPIEKFNIDINLTWE